MLGLRATLLCAFSLGRCPSRDLASPNLGGFWNWDIERIFLVGPLWSPLL